MFITFQFLSLAVALSLIVVLALRYFRLRHIPGPFLAAFTDFWQAYYQNTQNFTNVLTDLHAKYGAFVRTGPNRVTICDADAVTTIYEVHGQFKKAESYHALRVLAGGEVRGSAIDMDDERMATALKRAIGNVFSPNNVLQYEDELDETATVMMTMISKAPQPMNLFRIMQQFQIDFLSRIAFSEEPGYLKQDMDTWHFSFHSRNTHWARWQAIPGLERLIYKPPYISRFLSSQVPLWALTATEKLHARQALLKGPPLENEKADLLDKYLVAEEKHKDILPPGLVLRLVSSTISAGFDTTAFTMSAMVYYLTKNPSTLRKLQAEIDDAVWNGLISDPPRFYEVEKLEYLNAAFKEAMRCYPFLSIPLERIVPEQGAEIAGKWFPGGTVVSCHPTIVHRDSNVFGANADQFKPERWITADEAQTIRMERSSLGFGNGKRICLGRHLARTEVKKVMTALLMRFKLELGDPEAMLEPMDNFTSFPKPIYVRFAERKAVMSLP